MSAVIERETAQQAARRLSSGALRDGFLPQALHCYTDESGEPLFWRIRLKHPETGGKHIRPMRFDGGEFVMGEPAFDGGKPLYRLHEIAGNPDAPVFVVEGESCADSLAKLGLVASTSGGAGSAGAADWTPLAGRSVTVWPDHDGTGQQYGADVAGRLRALGCTVRMIDAASLNLPVKGDCADWLAARPDATAADVLALPDPVMPADLPESLRPKDEPALERLAKRAGAAPETTDAAVFARLAALTPAEYDRVRDSEATALGVRVGTLDAEIKRRRQRQEVSPDADAGRAFTLDAPEPWPAPVDGADLLDSFAASVSRHMVLPPGAADAIALWVEHAHCHDAADVSPIAAINSPTFGCGKTTLLEWQGAVVPKPLPASNITTAALFRSVEKWRPTLLIDEADTFLGASDDLRGLINLGHVRAAAFVIRVVPVGDDLEPRAFSTWAPKAIAMIGKMHPTLTSRSIVIELRRKGAGESTEPLRQSHRAELDVLRCKAARWAIDSHDRLRHAEPKMPDGLVNRGADNWRPLLAIADAAGGDWPDRAREAAKALSAARSDESHATTLLADLKAVFGATKADRLASTEIIAALVAMEDRPWPEWRDGRPLTPRQLAKVLEPFGIRPRAQREGRSVFKGYTRESFADAFARYLSPPAVTRSQPSTGAGFRDFASVTAPDRVTDAKTPKASTGAGCDLVTDAGAETTRGRACTAAEYAAKAWGGDV